MPHRFQLRLHRAPRNLQTLPSGDDQALGLALWARLLAALDRGRARPALVVLHGDRVEQFDLAALAQSVGPATGRVVAGLAARIAADRSTEVECSGIVGSLRLRRRGRDPVMAGVVFLEWPDGRWWTAHAPIAAEGGIQWPEPQIRAAVDGWPRPGGMGGWFSRARRERLVLRLETEPPAAAPGQEGIGLVH